MDALGHVNNVVYYRWLESARIAYLVKTGLGNLRGVGATEPGGGIGCILQHAQARFHRSVFFPDTVRVTSSLATLESNCVTLTHAVVSATQKHVVAVGSSTIVAYDYVKNMKTTWPAGAFAAMKSVGAVLA